MKFLLIAPFLFACNDAVLEETGDGLLRLASITGTIELGVTPSDDGRGTMLVILSIVSNDPEIIPHRVFVEPVIDFGLDGTTATFELTNIFPQEQPYHLGAFLDEDFSMPYQDDLSATSGDITSWGKSGVFDEIVLGSGEQKTMTLILDTVTE